MTSLPRPSEQINPVRLARVAGFFYLLQVALGPAMVAFNKVFLAGDPARTVSSLLAHESLFRLGFSGNLIAIASYIVVTALFYTLFKPVDQNISFLAACFGVIGCAILAFSNVFYFAPLLLVAGASTVAQSEPLVMLLLKLYAQGYNVSLVFFGFYCLTIGYLVFKSTFLPRALGVGMTLAGVGGLTFLSPSLARSLYPYVLLGGIGEAALTLWLLVFGVNRERWEQRSAVT